MKKFFIGLVVGIFLVGGIALAQQVPIYTEQGGAKMVIGSGGELEFQSGSILDLQAGVGVIAPAEVVTATNVITAEESGATFFLNSATEFASTLPAPALGLNYKFIVAAAPSGANYTVVTNGSANIINIVAAAGGIDDAADVAVARDIVSFVSAAAVVGDWLYCISDGTSWQCTGQAAVAAGLTTGQT